jgi:hypothetical protein
MQERSTSGAGKHPSSTGKEAGVSREKRGWKGGGAMAGGAHVATVEEMRNGLGDRQVDPM